MTTVTTGWERLNCSFFGMVCRRVLGPYFKAYGFKEHGHGVIGNLVYAKENIFVEITYIPETCPDYSTNVILGIGSDEHDEKWRLNSVPMWFLISEGSLESKYPFWTFRTETDLVEILTKIKSLLEQYARPLWLDVSALHKSVEKFTSNKRVKSPAD